MRLSNTNVQWLAQGCPASKRKCWNSKPRLLPTRSYHSRANLVSASEVTMGSASVASQRRWRGCSKERLGWAFLITFGNKGDCRGKKKWPRSKAVIWDYSPHRHERPKQNLLGFMQQRLFVAVIWLLCVLALNWSKQIDDEDKVHSSQSPTTESGMPGHYPIFTSFPGYKFDSVPSYSLPESSHLTVRVSLWLTYKLPALALQTSRKHLVFAQQLS